MTDNYNGWSYTSTAIEILKQHGPMTVDEILTYINPDWDLNSSVAKSAKKRIQGNFKKIRDRFGEIEVLNEVDYPHGGVKSYIYKWVG